MKKFSIVVALDSKLGIGKNNALPWHIPGDLKQFKLITAKAPEGTQNAVLMGRKTWDSLPEKFRPLPNRLNVIVSRQKSLDLPAGAALASSLDNALEICAKANNVAEIFVIGGSQLYGEALKHCGLERVYLTEVEGDFSCDCFFPEFESCFQTKSVGEAKEENGIKYTFKILEPEARKLAKCQVD